MRFVDKKDGHPALVVDALDKRFGKTVALEDVSFTVPEASLTVLLGAAGAGKTTTLRTIAGLGDPDAGSITLYGHDIAGWEPRDRDMAMIFDNLALYPNKTGFDNIASPLVIRGESHNVIASKVQDIAETLRVEHILHRLPKTMSGGERQRIALGRALIRTPSLFLLDEPLSSLDAKLRLDLRAELKRLQRDHGYTFLMATPDFNEALAVADDIIMLGAGKVLQIAKPQELYDNPADRETALFVGAPPINLIQAEYGKLSGGGSISFAGATISAPLHLADAFPPSTTSFELGIRPENLKPAELETARVRGELIDIEPLGLKSVLTVKNDAGELRFLVESEEVKAYTVGQNMGVDIIDTARLTAFDLSTGKNLSAA